MTNLIWEARHDGKEFRPIRAGLGELEANQNCQGAGLIQSRREKVTVPKRVSDPEELSGCVRHVHFGRTSKAGT